MFVCVCGGGVPVISLNIKLLDEHAFLSRQLKSSMKYEMVFEETVKNVRYEVWYFSIDLFEYLASKFILSLFSKPFS